MAFAELVPVVVAETETVWELEEEDKVIAKMQLVLSKSFKYLIVAYRE